MLSFFEDVEFGEGNKVRDFVFEEESVSLPMIVLDNNQDQGHIPDVVQEIIPELQGNVEILPNQVIHEEQTQQPQEQKP